MDMKLGTLHFHSVSILLLLLLQFAASHSVVKHLPGFQGPLPFHLETGYIGIGDSDQEAQLFYYFVKSERDPQNDPLILWHTGGPGCSGSVALAYTIGPLKFDKESFNGSFPTLLYSPYSWTKESSMIFMDSPVGVGFSYAKTLQARKTGDLIQARHSNQFLRKWLIDHPEFISNPLYVGGDSYAGFVVPIIVQEIINGNEHTLPFVNLQGYLVGNPVTILDSGQNFAISFAHRMTLISDELFESLERSCKGQYVNIDPSNEECLKHHDAYKECTSRINQQHILDSFCGDETLPRRSLHNILDLEERPSPNSNCIFDNQTLLVQIWANNDQVRKALYVREKTVGEWLECNLNLDYHHGNIYSVVPYHENISSQGFRSLIYSGDHDMLISHLDTQAWIKSLNYSIVDDWRPWFIENQVAGYTRTYANKMTFTTIKGGGHVPVYTQKECSIMVSRWMNGESL